MTLGSLQKHLEMRQRRWNSSIKTIQRHLEAETSRDGARERAESLEEGVEGGGEVAKDENTQKPEESQKQHIIFIFSQFGGHYCVRRPQKPPGAKLQGVRWSWENCRGERREGHSASQGERSNVSRIS